MTCRAFVLAAAMLFTAALIAVPTWAAPAAPAKIKAGITPADWGTTQKGEKVRLYTLTGKGGMVARITNFGGVVVDLIVPDRHGKPVNVVLGYDDLASYEKGGVYSALIGRYANRLSFKFPVDGKIYEQPAPPSRAGQSPRPYIQHGGRNGFQKRVWEAVAHDGPEPSLALTIREADGTGGFPGNITVTVTYTVRADNTLVLDYKGTTDKPTVMNLTNHFYFNLNGGAKDISDERLTLFSSRYTPFDANAMPTGVIAPVAGTPYDFTKPVRMGDRLALPDVTQTVADGVRIPGYDTSLLTDGKVGQLRPAARLEDPDTGIVMMTFTTQPGLELYTDNIRGEVKGRQGALYGNHWAISLETQRAADTPNHPNFTSAEVTPDRPLHEITEYRFSTLK
ncbi:MAG TPA: aldose epimerase family protein [Rhizomicrobium sp.]|jgi:aldose 1-epimerase|nr:aldose epimerase family protein [Rhizomicrobium sp.]